MRLPMNTHTCVSIRPSTLKAAGTMDDFVGLAVASCPFLHQLADRHGEQYARAIATRPCEPAGSSVRRPLLEELDDLQHTFTLFHGPSGVVPLVSTLGSASSGGCPFKHAAVSEHRSCGAAITEEPQRSTAACNPPLASISLAFGGANFGDFLFKHIREHMKQRRAPQARAPDAFSGSGPTASSSSLGNGMGPGPSSSSTPAGRGSGFSIDPPSGPTGKRPAPGQGSSGSGSSSGRGPRPPAGSADPAATHRGPPGPPASGPASFKGSGAAGGQAPGSSSSAAGACPLRKWLGPYAGLVFNQYDKLQCPPAIVAARAALARTPPVKALRPQAIEVKLLAVGAAAALLNVPCGAWREHTAKFSFEWFVAVHATIPFIAMLRKAVIMPKYAILFTIGAAVAGQLVGSRLERRRLQQQQLELEAGGVVQGGITAPSSGSSSGSGRQAHRAQHAPVQHKVDRGLLAAALEAWSAANSSSGGAPEVAARPGCKQQAAPDLAAGAWQAGQQQVMGLGAVLGTLPMVRC